MPSRLPIWPTDSARTVAEPVLATGRAPVIQPRRQRGGAEIIELALLVPIAMLLIMGIVEFSLLTSNTAILANAARVAVREAIRRPPTVTTPWTADQVKDFAKQAAAKLPLSNNNITLTPTVPATAASGTSITVAISYTHNWLFLFNKSGVSLNASSTMRVP
jgi:Flp pilus assembly protein TadG